MNKLSELTQQIKLIEGYKLSNTHFKIGSKIHSKDFYYAKRLFQNSYYTSRIALLIAKEINSLSIDKELDITLIGYEMYSELLISLIQKFLHEIGYLNINHVVTVERNNNLEIVPNSEEVKSNGIIIIPIASTGSTAIKIANYLKSYSKIEGFNIQLIEPFFNILRASDKELNSLNSDENKVQKPIVELKTEWQKPIECKWCFDYQLSKPLFQTDKTSLTPALIFDLPTAKPPTKNYKLTKPSDVISLAPTKKTFISFVKRDIDSLNFHESLLYRKVKRNGELFLFSNNSNVFIEENKSKIIKWLNDVKKHISLSPTDRILILSPCHYSNTMFLNMVNDIVFNSSATIIHHQSDVDYLANFKLLNSKYLSDNKTKVFFVDDTIISGRSFFNIYDLYRFTSDYQQNKNIKGAIFLSNNSSKDTNKRVERAIGSIFSFVHLNLPLAPIIFDKKPLEHEIIRYDHLSKIVMHDVLKRVFYTKKEDLLNPKINKVVSEKTKKERHYQMFRATHKAFAYFENVDTIGATTSYDDFLYECYSLEHPTNEIKFSMLKVLCQYPFLLYMPVRKKTFSWHKAWITEYMNRINVKLTRKENNQILYNDIQEYKFLLRRAVLLANYQVLSYDFLVLTNRLVKTVFESTSLEKIVFSTKKVSLFDSDNKNEEMIELKRELNEEDKSNIQDLHLFILKQYIELVHSNPWSAKKLNNSITNLDSNHSISPQLKRTFRMITIEISGVLNDFYLLLSKSESWRKLYKENEDNINEDNSLIVEYLNFKNPEFLQKNKFKLSDSILELKNGNELNPQFLNYLWVKQFLQTDKSSHATLVPLKQKTKSLFQKLMGFFEPDELGAFFIVNDGRKKSHIVYDKDSNNESLFHEEIPSTGIIPDFLDGQDYGISDAKNSIIEYGRSDFTIDSWIDLYSLNHNNSELNSNLTSPINWLLLIRLSDPKKINNLKDKENTLGMIGFYSKKGNPKDILALQLLMLVRHDLGKFIMKHHKNDEFSFLREVETIERFAYLAGHGRQMIQKLALEHKEHFGVVAKTMEKLQYHFATRIINPSGNTEYDKKSSNVEFIKSFETYNKVDPHVIQAIVNMGNKVFALEVIERVAELKQKIEMEIPDNLDFQFNSDILKFICFELFVNAKKNRFHFISGICTVCKEEKNSVNFNLCIDSDRLYITLTGTGPEILPKVKAQINSGNPNIKADREISGLNLIINVLNLLNTDNSIRIDSEEKCEHCGIHNNTVSLIINSGVNETSTQNIAY